MATRLEAALGQLAKALKGRPYVLVFQQNHPDAQTSNTGVVRPGNQPLFVSRGLCMEGHDFLVEDAGGRSTLSTKMHEGRKPDEAPARHSDGWLRNDSALMHLLGNVLVFGTMSMQSEQILGVISKWNDEEARYAEAWACSQHESGPPMARPKFFHDDWR